MIGSTQKTKTEIKRIMKANHANLGLPVCPEGRLVLTR